METYSFCIETLNEYANQVKDVLLQDLCANGIITDAQFKEFSKTKVITNIKLSSVSAFFKRLVKKIPMVGDLRIVVGTASMLKNEFEEQPLKKEDIREALKSSKL